MESPHTRTMSAPTGTLPRSSSAVNQGRRQACDRCSEQKVRCIRNAPTNDDGGDGEAVELARCFRCRKARAECVYSFYQRAGRPSKRPNTSSDLQSDGHSKRPTRNSTPTPSGTSTPTSKVPALSSIEVASISTMTMRQETEHHKRPTLAIQIDQMVSDAAPVELGPMQSHPVSAAPNDPELDTRNETTYQQCMAEFSLNDLDIWSGIPTLSTGSISPQVEMEPMQYPMPPDVTGAYAMTPDATDHRDDGGHRAETAAGTLSSSTASALSSMTVTATHVTLSPTTPDSTEAYIEQLAELNLAIFRSTRSMCASSGANTPVSMAWPFSGEIFEATSSLIRLIDAFSQAHAAADTTVTYTHIHDPMVLDAESSLHRETSPDHLNTEFGRATSASSTLKSVSAQNPDPGVALLILAAHQRLSSAFENMCASIHRYLQGMQEGSTLPFEFGAHQQSSSCFCGAQQQTFSGLNGASGMFMQSWPSTCAGSTASLNPFGGQAFAPSSTAQFFVIIELITYYLNRLDRALGPAVTGEPEQGPDFQAFLVQPVDVSDMSSSSSDESWPDIYNLGLGETGPASSRTQNSKTSERGSGSSGGSGSARALMRVGHEMHERYQTLRQHIREIKRVIRASNDS
ncbi:hypothetical protein B0J13DRAFT_569489 [Dactylonectria estremocensis]|uniref:Zn(2)-C6 fungal-type domain-containing protein n=1 Tax=Dactylonectria estremocensis TaxID=1079267 RepID=A0A9P9DG51_9HYPO|nr:hypothetical protein B0J13DRAFT_569489 [Dactylonectria estremocensis]